MDEGAGIGHIPTILSLFNLTLSCSGFSNHPLSSKYYYTDYDR
jgi:hypothetical protein